MFSSSCLLSSEHVEARWKSSWWHTEFKSHLKTKQEQYKQADNIWIITCSRCASGQTPACRYRWPQDADRHGDLCCCCLYTAAWNDSLPLVSASSTERLCPGMDTCKDPALKPAVQVLHAASHRLPLNQGFSLLFYVSLQLMSKQTSFVHFRPQHASNEAACATCCWVNLFVLISLNNSPFYKTRGPGRLSDCL